MIEPLQKAFADRDFPIGGLPVGALLIEAAAATAAALLRTYQPRPQGSHATEPALTQLEEATIATAKFLMGAPLVVDRPFVTRRHENLQCLQATPSDKNDNDADDNTSASRFVSHRHRRCAAGDRFRFRRVVKRRSVDAEFVNTQEGLSDMPIRGLTDFEHRTHALISRRRFAIRMLKAVGLWLALAVIGLAIGMTGYIAFEGMSLPDAYVNAAMILSGMGPMGELKTTGGKIFAGSYAIFSGLVIVIATAFVLAPIFHRVLHRFHVEAGKDD